MFRWDLYGCRCPLLYSLLGTSELVGDDQVRVQVWDSRVIYGMSCYLSACLPDGFEGVDEWVDAWMDDYEINMK